MDLNVGLDIHFQGFIVYLDISLQNFGRNMDMNFQKFHLNMGIHFGSWMARPHPELGRVHPLPQRSKVKQSNVYTLKGAKEALKASGLGVG